MNPVTFTLPKKAVSRSEREELLQFFFDEINKSRKRDGFPPLRFGYLLKLTKGKTTSDLYQIKSLCMDADRQYHNTLSMRKEERRGAPFSAAFFSRLKKRYDEAKNTEEN